MYYPEVKRGILEGQIYYRGYRPTFTINESVYVDQIMDPNYPWPGEFKEISEQEINYYNINKPNAGKCNFYYLFNLTEAEVKKNKNTYLIDYQNQFQQYNDSDDGNYTSAALSGYFVSHLCATQFKMQGVLYNNALQTKEESVYTAIFLVLEILALISGIRFTILTSAPQRVARLSLASFLLQTGFDFIIGSLYSTFAAIVSGLRIPLIGLSIVLYVYALFVDLPVVASILTHDAVVRGRRHNLCAWFIVIFLLMTVFILVQQFLPNWTYFILIILLSSYWIVQSIFSFANDIIGSALPFDYIAINYLIKCAPVVYFYGCKNNFMNFQVEDWYLYVIIIWFSLQLIIQILQYFFGNRFGIKKQSQYVNPEKQSDYDYDQQCLTTVCIKEIDQLTPDQIKQAIDQGKGATLIPLPYKQQVPPQGELSDDQEICLNPLHEHSVLYNHKYGMYDLIQTYPILQSRKEALLKLQPEQTKCFIVVSLEKLNDLFTCGICLDSINFDQIENKTVLCISKDKVNNDEQNCNQNAYQQEMELLKNENSGKKDYGIWITPCGHVFHKQCLCKWGQENLSCPVDRQNIPPMKKYNWYE